MFETSPVNTKDVATGNLCCNKGIAVDATYLGSWLVSSNILEREATRSIRAKSSGGLRSHESNGN